MGVVEACLGFMFLRRNKYEEDNLCLCYSCVLISNMTTLVSADVYQNCPELEPEYVTLPGQLTGGLYRRYYNMDEVYEEEIRAIIRQCIADWNWHLNPDNDGQGVDCYFIQVSSVTDLTSAQINFVQYETMYPGDEWGAVDAITLFLDANGQQMNQQQLYIDCEDWYGAYIGIFTPALPRLADGSYDIESIRATINHEIGHAFGLLHNKWDVGTLMWEASNRTAHVPTAADLNGIYAIYG